MAKPAIGVLVQYCGHNGCFLADIWEIEGVNVVRASREVTPDNLDRKSKASHHISDYPKAGYWRPAQGIFVVPKNQVTQV